MNQLERFITNAIFKRDEPAYCKGYDCGSEDIEKLINPYPLDSDEWYSWCEGYLDGRMS